MVLMNLLFTNCLPILTYGSKTVEFLAGDMRNFDTANNEAIRRVYAHQQWESVRVLCESAKYPNIYDIFSRHSDGFLNGNLKSMNRLVVQLTILLVS